MTDLLLVAAILAAAAMGFWSGWWISRIRTVRQYADLFHMRDVLIAELRSQLAAQQADVVTPSPTLMQPHEHKFSTEPQASKGDWAYWSCQYSWCKAEQVRRRVAV